MIECKQRPIGESCFVPQLDLLAAGREILKSVAYGSVCLRVGCLFWIPRLLDRLVNHLFVVEGDGSVTMVEGKFSDYRQAQREEELERRRSSQASSKSVAVVADKEKATGKKLSYKERKELQTLEHEVDKAEGKHAELSARLESDAGMSDYSKLAEWTDELARLQDEIDEKGERWMELAERAEA